MTAACRAVVCLLFPDPRERLSGTDPGPGPSGLVLTAGEQQNLTFFQRVAAETP